MSFLIEEVKISNYYNKIKEFIVASVTAKVFQFFESRLREESVEGISSHLLLFTKLFVLHCAISHGVFLFGAPEGHLLKYSFLPLALAIYLSLTNTSQKGALWIIAAIYICDRLMYPLWGMPIMANHVTLEWITLALLLYLNYENEEEGMLLLVMIRFLCIFVFFYAGLQKLLYGSYFFGTYMSFEVASNPYFKSFFSLFLSEDVINPALEYQQQVGFDFLNGQWLNKPEGQYRINNIVFIAMSNLAWIGEIAVAFLLLTRRFRVCGALLGISLLLFIELAAREFFFGILYSVFMLMFLDEKYLRRFLPLAIVLYTFLALCVLEVIPFSLRLR